MSAAKKLKISSQAKAKNSSIYDLRLMAVESCVESVETSPNDFEGQIRDPICQLRITDYCSHSDETTLPPPQPARHPCSLVRPRDSPSHTGHERCAHAGFRNRHRPTATNANLASYGHFDSPSNCNSHTASAASHLYGKSVKSAGCAARVYSGLVRISAQQMEFNQRRTGYDRDGHHVPWHQSRRSGRP